MSNARSFRVKAGVGATVGVFAGFAAAPAIVAAAPAVQPAAVASRSVAEPNPLLDPVDVGNLDPVTVTALVASMNDLYETHIATRSQEVPDGVTLTPTPSGIDVRPFTVESVDFYQTRREDGSIDTRVVPAGTEVRADGSETPPAGPTDFSAQVGQAWGSEIGDHYSCFRHEWGGDGSPIWAENCTQWLKWKLDEANPNYDYTLVQSVSQMRRNPNDDAATFVRADAMSWAQDGGIDRLDRQPIETREGACSDWTLEVGISQYGASASASKTFRRCEKIEPIGDIGDGSQFFGALYTAPSPGQQDVRSMATLDVLRGPAGWNKLMVYGHSVQAHLCVGTGCG